MELNYHIQVERMKRELEQMRGFSTVAAFKLMDVKGFNYLDWESLMIYLKNNARGTRKKEQPTKHKINAIFRRIDTNADTRLGFSEFAEAIKPVDVYFTDIHRVFKNERDISEQKKMTEM
jgi:Ca2+-binding EF-hand superfamily protein